MVFEAGRGHFVFNCGSGAHILHRRAVRTFESGIRITVRYVAIGYGNSYKFLDCSIHRRGRSYIHYPYLECEASQKNAFFAGRELYSFYRTLFFARSSFWSTDVRHRSCS